MPEAVEDPRRSRWRVDVVVAVVTALAALGGAAIGGAASFVVSNNAQNRTDQRAAAANAALARGAARVLEAHYGEASLVIDVMLHSDRYMLAPPLVAGLTYDDKKRLAATVPAAMWDQIAETDGDLESLVQLIETYPELRVLPLTGADRTNLRAMQKQLLRTATALRPVSGD